MSKKKETREDEPSRFDESQTDAEFAEDALAHDVAAAKTVSSQRQSIDNLSELDRLQLELHESEQRVLRVQADLENFRKRTRRDAEESIKYAATPLLRDMLSVIDNLHRAMEAQQADATAKGLLEGVRMVADQLTAVLDQHQCHVIVAQGETFDPVSHEAVLQQDSDLPAGTIIQVTQVGYRLHDRVIRPAQVIVSKGPVS